MLGLLSGLLGILPTISNTINSITNAIANEKVAQINATTDEEKAVIDERIKTLEAKRDVLVAEIGHSNVDLWIRILLSVGPATYLTKIFIWDEVLGWGSTPDVSNNLWQVITAVIGFYFLYSGAMGVTRVLKS
jgi:phosphatidylglycerophosphatase A